MENLTPGQRLWQVLREGVDRGGWITLKTIPSHSGKARWLAEVDPDPDAKPDGNWIEFPSNLIPSPYYYSKYRMTYNWNGQEVICVETSHKRFEIIKVPDNVKRYDHDPSYD
jgi:hypothetical protein